MVGLKRKYDMLKLKAMKNSLKLKGKKAIKIIVFYKIKNEEDNENIIICSLISFHYNHTTS